MRKSTFGDGGSAMALVLIFVTMLGGSLGVTLLVSQVSTSGIQRMNLQTASSSQIARATATALEQLIVNPTYGSSAFTSATQSNCGLPSTISGVSVSCTAVTAGSQALTSAAVTTTSSSGSATGVDNGISVTGSHSFNSVIQSFSNNVTVASGNVTAPQILTPAGTGISGVTAISAPVTGTAANLPSNSVTPILPVSDPGTGISGSINSYLPTNCPGLNNTITIPSGNYNDEAIDQLNQLFSSELIRTYKSNGSYTDKDCSENWGWGHKIDIAFGQGTLYFKGTKLLDIRNNADDATEKIKIHNDSSDAVEVLDSKGNPSGCNYKHGLTPLNPTSSANVSGTQIIFGGSATLSNTDGDFSLCGPYLAMGQSYALMSLDDSHATVCATKLKGSSNCPSAHTGSTPLLRTYGNSGTKTYVYGTVLASGSSVRIDQGVKGQHEIDGGIIGDGAKFTCTLANGSCQFPVQAGPAVTGRRLKIKFTTSTGVCVEHEIVIDDNSGLNPGSHVSITNSGS